MQFLELFSDVCNSSAPVIRVELSATSNHSKLIGVLRCLSLICRTWRSDNAI